MCVKASVKPHVNCRAKPRVNSHVKPRVNYRARAHVNSRVKLPVNSRARRARHVRHVQRVKLSVSLTRARLVTFHVIPPIARLFASAPINLAQGVRLVRSCVTPVKLSVSRRVVRTLAKHVTPVKCMLVTRVLLDWRRMLCF